MQVCKKIEIFQKKLAIIKKGMVLFNSSLREIQNSETQKKKYGSMVKRLRHRPFTAVTGVQIPLESLKTKLDIH